MPAIKMVHGIVLQLTSASQRCSYIILVGCDKLNKNLLLENNVGRLLDYHSSIYI